MKKSLLVLALACIIPFAGCSTLVNAVKSVPTEPFTVSLCADGAVVIPCTNLGEVKVPTGGDTIASLILAVAAPHLAKQANLKSCLFETFPSATGGDITVTATATCKLNGVPVTEGVTLKLTPVATVS